jgi:hypothetical protein
MLTAEGCAVMKVMAGVLSQTQQHSTTSTVLDFRK